MPETEAMKPKILWVDDDPNIIAATQRYLRKSYTLHAAFNANEGLIAIDNEGPFAVIISDLKMPRVDGIEFLSQAHTVAPDSVRIMLTGFAEQNVAIKAVNRGQIFRFLTKPSHPEEIQAALADAVRQYELVRAERELLEKTLIGSVQVMTDLLALTNPLAFAHVREVKIVAMQVATEMKLPDLWKLEAAVILSQIGLVTVPEKTLQKFYRGKELDSHEHGMVAAHPKITHDLLGHIPRLEDAAKIISMHGMSSNSPAVQEKRPIPLAANILRTALDYDRLRARGLGRTEAIHVLRHQEDVYNSEIVDLITKIRAEGEDLVRQYLYVDELKNGMILDEEILTAEGMLLVPCGMLINDTIRQRLRNFRLHDDIGEKLWVKIPTTSTEEA